MSRVLFLFYYELYISFNIPGDEYDSSRLGSLIMMLETGDDDSDDDNDYNHDDNDGNVHDA